jgi:twitching motility protein PilT
LNLSKTARGLIVISGPIDSGRSTLAAALLQNILDTSSVRVMTLEEPLEYLLQPQRGAVEQRQIGRDVESVAAGLELISQEDVEVIFISAIETKEEILALTKLALSDRLVIVLIDSDSAVRSLETLVTQVADAKMTFVNNIADALQAVVNLRLLPRQGMPGRVYATEVLLNTPTLRLALRDGDFTRMHNVLQTSRQEGMITLDQSLLDLVAAGLISKESALQVSHDTERLQSNLH